MSRSDPAATQSATHFSFSVIMVVTTPWTRWVMRTGIWCSNCDKVEAIKSAGTEGDGLTRRLK